ncbi:hypothetical protein [Actinomadura sp. 3N407]|uniref:hypothetical protein n=1 Tax=Actinomadura sp. 3N407 TaxID=3457423 RepID=UPI003FCCD52D
MPQETQALIFFIIAVCTFMLKGKQWPTFITAGIMGFFLAGAGWSDLGGAFETLFNGVKLLFS